VASLVEVVRLPRYHADVADYTEIDAILARLRDCDDIEGIVVFGSRVRNELQVTSDIDLLVVHSEDLRPANARSLIKQSVSADLRHRLSVTCFTRKTLLHEFDKHPSFAAHLADEGTILHKRGGFEPVEHRLNSTQLNTAMLTRELAVRTYKLHLFRNLERFNGEFVLCLARLYAIGRSVVIIKLLQHDIHEYSWKRLFDAYASIHPELEPDLSRIESLRPCYEHVHDRRSSLPGIWTRIDPRRVDETIDAISTLSAS
jgi:predicted nucleotidyltransferase